MKQFVYSPKSLGIALKRYRKLKGLNQNEVAQSFKLEQSTISHVENGVPGTRLDTLFRILASLDLEMVIQKKTSNEEIEE